MIEEARKIKVLIVDDHPIVRQGLRTFLELQSDISVVGEAEDGEAAIKLVPELNPDIVLMDLVMPRTDGITATRLIKSQDADVKVIALTSFAEDDKVYPAIQAGASSYLLKDAKPDILVETIRAVNRGEVRLHPAITRKLMEEIVQKNSSLPGKQTDDPTFREREVIRLVVQGRSNHEIAKELFISEKTVKTHISNILSKLHLEDRTQLAIYAIRKGLVDQA